METPHKSLINSVLFKFTSIPSSELNHVLAILKAAAEKIAKKNVKHWQYWQNPPVEKIAWVKKGLKKEEFFYIEDQLKTHLGILRLMDEDLIYLGKQSGKAKYIHSLVIFEQFNGRGLGAQLLEKLALLSQDQGYQFLRLDCDRQNPKLCRYYENLGFEKAGQVKLSLSTYQLYEKKIGKN